jgi:hypothetical protein
MENINFKWIIFRRNFGAERPLRSFRRRVMRFVCVINGHEVQNVTA